MAFLPLTLLTLLSFASLSRSFTVISSDSGALLDGPQSGFSKNPSGVRTAAAEQLAVYDVMTATGNSWAVDIPDICGGRWHGIECMPDKDNLYHVVSLSFGALSDDTAFPTCDPTRSFLSPSITNLPHLRTLFFYRCFTGNPQGIPSFLGQLGPSLQTLVLRENGHVGPIPDGLANLTRLRVLDLHGNGLNGSIPASLNRLTGLRSLDLSQNKLTGSIPSLGLPGLRVLDLNRNFLSDSIPSGIGMCRGLIKVDLSRNRLVGRIPESIGGLKDLVLVDFSHNRISSPLPLSLGLLGSLEVLILKGNPMGPDGIPGGLFDGMVGLMTVVLSNMGFQGPIPVSLGRLLNLRVLRLDGNRFNGTIPTSFRDLKNLNDLSLSDNLLTGPIPLAKEMIWSMKRKLKLGNNLGLCYESDDGIDGGAGSSYNAGIGPCHGPGIGPGRFVEHVFVDGKNGPISVGASVRTVHKSSVLVRLLHLTTCLWFIIKIL